MTILRLILAAVVAVICAESIEPSSKISNSSQSLDGNTPVVALVQKSHGRLVISINPDPAPGTDPLTILNHRRKKLGSNHPVVAIVDDDAKISDLWQVAGTAGKAGFEKTRTFVHTRNNGAMFEVAFGPNIRFSKTGRFEPKTSER